MTIRRLGATALTLALATAAASPALAGPTTKHGNPNTPDKLAKAVTAEAILGHLETFQEIALQYPKHRAATSEGYEATAEYVEATLQAAGYSTERQYFSFEHAEVLAQSLVENSPSQRTLDARAMSYSPSTPGALTADLAAPAVPTGCSLSDYAGMDLSGSIALVSRGTCSFSQKSLVASQAGAEAVIVYNNTDGALNGTLGEMNDGHVPAAGITLAEGQALLAEMATGPVNVTLDLQIQVRTVETFNILAETAKGRTDNVVMLGAHLDSVEAGPGINDNGSGAATILETAVQLAGSKQLNNQVRFAFWGAEELGLLGSTYYVEDLVANDPAELENIAAYLNYDMLGSPNYVIGVYDADESTYAAPVTVPEGSVPLEDIYTDYFDSIGQPWVDSPYSGRSDYQAFIEAGIPSGGLASGADGSKTAEEVEMFGGVEGAMYDPNYHTPADNLANLNLESLDIMSDAVAYTAMTLAMDTSVINGKESAGKSGKAKGPKGPHMELEQERASA